MNVKVRGKEIGRIGPGYHGFGSSKWSGFMDSKVWGSEIGRWSSDRSLLEGTKFWGEKISGIGESAWREWFLS